MREIILDTETTGLDPADGHKIVEIGCVELVNRIRTGNTYQVYINPLRNMPKEAFQVHGISEEFLKDKKVFREIADEFVEFVKDSTLIIHNARFDMKFLNSELNSIGYENLAKMTVIDTLDIARKKFPGSPASLDALCKKYKVDISKRTKHGALLDAELLSEVYIHLTGGNQTALDLQVNKEIETRNLMKVPKQFKEPRSFEITDLEKEEHQKVMEKVKKPIWS